MTTLNESAASMSAANVAAQTSSGCAMTILSGASRPPHAGDRRARSVEGQHWEQAGDHDGYAAPRRPTSPKLHQALPPIHVRLDKITENVMIIGGVAGGNRSEERGSTLSRIQFR